MGRVFRQPGFGESMPEGTVLRDVIDVVRRLLRWGLGDVTLTAVHAPGHTSEMTAYRLGNVLFGGETLQPVGAARPGGREFQQQAGIRHHHHGMTYAEVAAMLNISVHTVETQMSRAFKTLRTLLAHCTPLLLLTWA